MSYCNPKIPSENCEDPFCVMCHRLDHKLGVREETDEAVIEAVDRERERIRCIIEYICNKNSKPISQGGFNHDKFLMDIEELERELSE